MEQPDQSPPSPLLLTYEDFRAFVAGKEGRYEFVDGRAVALASPSATHSLIATKLIRRLDQHLDSSGCDTHGNQDVWTGQRARRPDVLVTCDERDRNSDEQALRFPKLIIEILSPATLTADLQEKLAEYQAMPSIEEYIVVDSRKRWLRHYQRGVEGLFVFDHDHIGGSVRFASVGYSLDIDAVYDEARVR